MPGRDRTGPMGMGPMTGRAAGFCAGFGMPRYSNFASRRGIGGGCRGGRNGFYATGQPGWMRFGGSAGTYQNADPELEKQALKRQSETLQSELDLVKKRLSRIVSETAAE